MLMGRVAIGLKRRYESGQPRSKNDQVTGARSCGICMRHARTNKYRRARARSLGSIGIAECELAVQYVPGFVIGAVEVEVGGAAAAPLMDAEGIARS